VNQFLKKKLQIIQRKKYSPGIHKNTSSQNESTYDNENETKLLSQFQRSNTISSISDTISSTISSFSSSQTVNDISISSSTLNSLTSDQINSLLMQNQQNNVQSSNLTMSSSSINTISSGSTTTISNQSSSSSIDTKSNVSTSTNKSKQRTMFSFFSVVKRNSISDIKKNQNDIDINNDEKSNELKIPDNNDNLSISFTPVNRIEKNDEKNDDIVPQTQLSQQTVDINDRQIPSQLSKY